MYKDIEYFSRDEMRCKCGCNSSGDEMDKAFLMLLDELRVRLNRPIAVSSGYRCISHNDKEGGVESSSHVRGFAVDIRIYSSYERWQVINEALLLGVNRIGVSRYFVHLDQDPDKPNFLIWTY